MSITPTRVAVGLALALAVGVAWYVDGRGRWRTAASDRLLYGVPWGTAVTVVVVVAFYLLVQGGLDHWDDPVTYAFVTWSYFYPEGLLTAGLAHGGPNHLLSNMTATAVFGVIAEYAWGHYPGPDRRNSEPTEESEGRADGGRDGLLVHPGFRAFVAFPAALLVVAFFTAAFSLGPGLGFSGAVYAVVGFAVVVYPLATVVGLAVTSSLSVVIDALASPVVRETVEVGPPMPPGWAGVGFQAHLLGFLVGALAAVALLSRRGRRPSFATLAFGVLVVGAVQALWLLPLGGSADEYVLYRGVGVVMVVGVTLVVAGAAAGSDRRIPRPFGGVDWIPSRRTLSIAWLAVVLVGFLLGVGGVFFVGDAIVLSIGVLVVLAAVLAVPGLTVVLPDHVVPTPVSRRHAAATVLVVVTALVALVSVPMGLTVVGDDAVPETNAMAVDDYAVTYAENTTSGQSWVIDVSEEEDAENGTVSGVIVVNDEREMWTLGVTDELLAFEGEGNVTVGGVDWRETIHVERTGWEVLGNDTVYAVDVAREGDGETTRAFTSESASAAAELDGHTVDVVPTDDGFDLEVSADGEDVGTASVPDVGESTSVGDLSFSTVESGDAARVVAATDDARVQIAERETYPSATN